MVETLPPVQTVQTLTQENWTNNCSQVYLAGRPPFAVADIFPYLVASTFKTLLKHYAKQAALRIYAQVGAFSVIVKTDWSFAALVL